MLTSSLPPADIPVKRSAPIDVGSHHFADICGNRMCLGLPARVSCAEPIERALRFFFDSARHQQGKAIRCHVDQPEQVVSVAAALRP